jgi:hypothetical protein
MLFAGVAALGQTNTGELRLAVTDPAGLPLPSTIEISSEANRLHRVMESDARGQAAVKRLPFGPYRVEAHHAGFAAFSELVEIRSAVPKELKVALSVAPIESSVTVTDDETLLDPYATNSVNRIGGDELKSRLASLPGRDLASLVNQEPGWVFEANGTLHPRASEYQTQYVLDGIPFTDNRSAAFAPDFDADQVQEMSVMTAGYPAEYGRKLGGVVEVETQRDTRQGFHGRAAASGGSFGTAAGFLEAQEGWARNTLTVSAASATTDRFLDPPVLQNYTNHGTTESYSAHYERDINETNRVGVIFRREQSAFLVPNEIVEQAAGQRQDRESKETALQFSYTHIFSPTVVGDFRGMARDLSANFWSNDLSTPMIVEQERGYREGYVKGTISAHKGNHELKAGAEGDFAGIRESLGYAITDPTQFDPGTPLSFHFRGRAPDREQGAFAQDLFRWKNLTLSGGIRFDHYSLLVDQSAWSPRAGIAYYWPWANIVFRASYDRVFQTPAFENLLLSSSAQVVSLSGEVLRLPVEPSHGNFYQAGFGKTLGKLRLDVNLYRRAVNNYADDDLLLNTGVSFPIAFSHANIYGTEVKLEIPHWGPLSGYVSYANSRGNGYFPVTGGLFLGDDAANALSTVNGVFPVSQDQRNTVRARFRYEITKRIWVAAGGSYDSGLPFDFTGTHDQAAAQYGPDILARVNFSNGRTRPGFSLNTSAGIKLSDRERAKVSFQADVTNLTNRLNVIDFAGLFSGTALGEPRSVNARLQVSF